MKKIEIQIARKFHKVYEKLAPEFGYTTRPETREFDENSSNGKLMIAVCKEVVLEELDKAREEGRREVLNKEIFIGDYDILMQGLHIRTIDRENFLAQIYKTVKERYDWAFGTATYKQALKMIENSLTSPFTPYVGTDKMVDEARIEVLSKLKTKEVESGVEAHHEDYDRPYDKDTPEQKKDWEEDFRGFLDFVIEGDSNKKEVVEYVKNLLDEREAKAFNEGVKEMEDSEQIQADWDIEELRNIVDKIVKKLDKLNKKK